MHEAEKSFRNFAEMRARQRRGLNAAESSCFSGKVDPPLDGHKIEIAEVLTLRCKSGEIGPSNFVHLTERILVIIH